VEKGSGKWLVTDGGTCVGRHARLLLRGREGKEPKDQVDAVVGSR
jgi:hypothetical protein